jgi:hypothetical protein
MSSLSQALLTAVLALAFVSDDAQASAGNTDFQILMNGRAIGNHKINVTEAGGITTARISINMAGRVGPIGFTYAHRCTEKWRGDQLIDIECTDRENRNTKTLSGNLVGGNLEIKGSGFNGNLPADIMPTSWWRFSTVNQSRVMNSRDGKLTNISARRIGTEMVETATGPILATHYRIRGPANTELYYDGAGRWVGNSFRLAGQSFLYRKLTPASGAPRE